MAGAGIVEAAGKSMDPFGGCSEVHSLPGLWGFRFDPDGKGETEGWHRPGPAEGWDNIAVPHTWNIDPAHANYWGVGWYRREIKAPERWSGRWVRLEFESIYHTATVWLNGQEIGRHERKGYTAFWVDLSPSLHYEQSNVLVVKADNTFRDDMLPRSRSYDWVADGGITRSVNLHVTPRVFLERTQVDAEPELGRDTASVRVLSTVRNTTDEAVTVKLYSDVMEEGAGDEVLRMPSSGGTRVEPNSRLYIRHEPGTISEPKLWHFDHPHLYNLRTRLETNGAAAHESETIFGVRKIEIQNAGFYLNGERVWLTGVERMAGSNPEYGMAEPEKWLVHDHDDMKELNCVFTRVHWQQDRRLLDYCDRHGILIQLEVPSWGPDTFRDLTPELEEAIQQNGLEQLREMISRDRNHPCIFSWGLCNEVDGQNPAAQKFVRRMYREAKKLDPARLLTYASNSLQKTPRKDVSGEMDFIMWNEYYESWYGRDVQAMEKNLQEINQAFPAKPIVISEYGYCECNPAHTGGDPKRIEVLREHNEVFRKHDFVGGTIFFSYNDYRTHIGDKGLGPLKQRVHGVVDLYGNRKPSFEELRDEASPIEELLVEAKPRELAVTIQTRRRLPGYTLCGYGLRWILFGFGGLPMESGELVVPDLAPGAEHELTIGYKSTGVRRVQVDVMRPTRFSAATIVANV